MMCPVVQNRGHLKRKAGVLHMEVDRISALPKHKQEAHKGPPAG